MSLRHIAIPSWPAAAPPRFPTYALATRVQTALQQAQQAWKATVSSPSTEAASLSPSSPPPPPPSLISFTPAPTYTLGRRQTEPLTAAELARLRAPLRVSSASGSAVAFTPEVLHAPRGGLATYHGPGQVVLWPVVDLRSPLHSRFGVREYTCALEKTTISTLRRLFGIDGFTTSNPGVWVRSSPGKGQQQTQEGEGEGEGEDRKISALGVHLRRHVAGLGVAINLGMPVAGSEDANPWARIVACGLHDRGVTSVAAHLGLSAGPSAGDVAAVWAEEFAARLGVVRGDGSNGSSNDVPVVENEDWKVWERRLELDGADDNGYVEGHALQT